MPMIIFNGTLVTKMNWTYKYTDKQQQGLVMNFFLLAYYTCLCSIFYKNLEELLISDPLLEIR